MFAVTSQTCGFCHEMVPVGTPLCPACGHEPHVGRMHCLCRQCRPAARPVGSEGAVSLACRHGGHGGCRLAGCVCGCHRKEKADGQ